METQIEENDWNKIKSLNFEREECIIVIILSIIYLLILANIT